MAKIKSLQSSTGVSAGTVSTLALGGSGEINYIENPSDVTDGWTASGAGVTCTTYTTTADLPRQITEGTGIKLTGVSGSTAYMYYRFTLDRSDYGKKLKVVWDQAPISGYSASHFKVDVYSNTASNYTGTSTRLSLSTDSSSVTGIPNLTGSFRTTFDAPSSTSPYIEVRIGLNGAYTSSCVFSNIIVGPGIVIQGAAVSEWQSCTATFTNLAGTQTAVMRRLGDSMHLRAKSVLSGVAGGTMSIDIPSGYTHDTTKYNGASGTRVKVGTVTFWDASASATYNGDVVYIIGTGIRFYGGNNQTLWNATSPVASVSTDEVVVDMVVPIAEWAGSGTVNISQNDVEYASNSSATDAADTTSFAYGPAGSAGILKTTAMTATRAKRVRFLTPIQQTDKIEMEVYDPTSGVWQPLNQCVDGNLGFSRQNATFYGAYWASVSSSTTDVDVSFTQYATPNGATFSAAGSAWTSTTVSKWRLKKSSGGQAVGFGEVQPGIAAGLVSSSGLKGSTSGTATAAGYVGEILKSTFTSSSTSPSNTQFGNATSISLTAGTWLLYGAVMNTRVASQTVMQLAISAYSNNTTTDHVNGVNVQRFDAPSWNITSMSVGPWPVNISAGATYYLKVYQDAGSFTSANWSGNLTAVRIA